VYKKLTLYHGHSIVYETGTNTTNYSNTRMIIASDGNVGIGTTTPALKLHLDGQTGFPATIGSTQIGAMRVGVTGGMAQSLILAQMGFQGKAGYNLQTEQTWLIHIH
jgi:hypothetical protein